MLNIRKEFKRDNTIAPTEFVGAFPKNGVSIVASKPGVGKTWFVLNTMTELAYEGKKSLTFFGDCPPNVIYDRINSLRDFGKDLDSSLRSFYFLTDAIREKVNIFISSEEGIHNLCEIINEEKPDIVFFDTFSSLTQIEENSQKDTSSLFQKLIVIAERFKCAIVILHHLRKSSRKERSMNVDLDDVIGSSIITRLASLVIVLSRDGDDVNVNVVKTWYQKQENYLTNFKVVTASDGYVDILTLRTRNEGGNNIMGKILTWIYELRKNTPEKGNVIVADSIVASLGISVTAARTALNAICQEEHHVLTQSKFASGKYFYIINDDNLQKMFS